MLRAFLENIAEPVEAHCDLMCGVYDPAQARIEAQSVYNTVRKYHQSDDELFRQRCVYIKEERAELVKHHLWVLWTDYFKPHHVEEHPNLHDLIWRATKAAGDVKKSTNQEDAQNLLDLVDEVGGVFAQTKDGYDYQTVKDNMNAQSV
jgi:nickel superoxide dismutase